MSDFHDIQLERVQARMLDSVHHGREVQLTELVLCLGSFRNRLAELHGWSTQKIKPWLHVLGRHLKRIGFPEHLAGHLVASMHRKDLYLLRWVVAQAVVSYNILLEQERRTA